ncbi:unnamed protein product [Phaedon cochleariae]|uniref:BED-type domain-containing protein n=1 Tax=Phaedon cochleariae TaxID=80249 RepID=A0A9N9X8B7_PHACE|nr:unnamed protein product [Phaedon cochleariae]
METSNSSDEVQDPYHNSSESDVDYIPPEKKKSSKIIDFFINPKSSALASTSSIYSNKVSKKDGDLVLEKRQKSNNSAPASTARVDHIEKCKNSPMLDGKFFIVEKCDEKMNCEAMCQLCLPTKKMIKGSLESTTNFVKHLKRVHGEKSYNDYVKYKEKLKSRRTTAKDDSGASISASTIERSKQETLKRFVNSKVLVTQKEFERRIVNFIVNTMSAVSVIENPSFIRLFDGMNVNVIGRKAAMKLITDMYNIHIDKLKKEIEKQDYICCTADIWSTKTRSFMGVTLHWIDANLERHSVALACKRFSGIHDYKNIGEMLENINLKFGIKSTQIIATVTDNGSNFVKAFREFSMGEEEVQDFQQEIGRTHEEKDEDDSED